MYCRSSHGDLTCSISLNISSPRTYHAADPSLKVLGAGVKELFKDSRIFVMHSDALEQIEDGVSMLVDYGEKALARLRWERGEGSANTRVTV